MHSVDICFYLTYLDILSWIDLLLERERLCLLEEPDTDDDL